MVYTVVSWGQMSTMTQSRLDALADAETLVRLGRTPIHRTNWGGYLAYCANNVLLHQREGGYLAAWAKAAAHAAFCAVPGLRDR